MTRSHYWKMRPIEIYSLFLQMGERLIESNSATQEPPTKRRVYQHEMYVKFIYHLASIMTLENGTVFSVADPSKRIHDYSSIVVLLRAALETFLTYYYVYCDSSQADELDFRYYNWLTDGLGFRQRVDVSFSEELKHKQAAEQAQIQEAVDSMKKTATFRALSDKQKRVVTDKLEWLRPRWSDILVRVGFSDYWARMFYGLYSTYAHTSSQSIMQFKDATVRQEGGQLSSSFANLVHMGSALFTEYYTKGFGLGGTLTDQEMEMIEAWTWMAKHLQK